MNEDDDIECPSCGGQLSVSHGTDPDTSVTYRTGQCHDMSCGEWFDLDFDEVGP